MNADPVNVFVLGIPGLALLWVLTLVVFTVFGRRVYRIIGLLRQARPENRFDRIGERVRRFARHGLLQPRLFNERSIGLPHFLIFWGFVLYAVCFGWSLMRGLLPFLRIPYPDDVSGVVWFLEIFAVLVLIGLGVAAARRAFFAPPHLHRSWDANLILALIAVLMLSTLLGQGFRAAAETVGSVAGVSNLGSTGYQPVPSGDSPDGMARPSFTKSSAGVVLSASSIPVGGSPTGAGESPALPLLRTGSNTSSAGPIGGWLGALTAKSGTFTGSATALAKVMWWTHMVVVLFFLVYLPYSKHLHLLAAPFSVLFANLRPVGDLSLAGANDDASAGASKWNEFTWKQLLNGFSCAECGRCDRACPAQTSGFPLSPQQIVQKLKQHLLAAGWAKSAPLGPLGNGSSGLVGGAIAETEIWACTTCLACMERCAVLNEQIPLIIRMRRHLVNEGRVNRTLQDMLDNLTRYGNSFGKSDRLRAKWTQSLGWKIKDARKEPVEYLWFLGDYASYDPRLEATTRLTANIFQQAGLNFGILYEDERNSGNDVRRVGEEGLFEMLREKNLQMLAKAQFQTVITTDPHTYNTLKNEYHFERNGHAVLHYSEVLNSLISQDKLPLKRQLAERVTYHDPCYLGRYNEIYDPPRRVLRALGVELVEMPRNRNRSYCCGAGGGRIWMEDSPGIKERPSESRIREAVALDGVSALVVTCPKDIGMFRDALKTTGNEGKIVVKDLAELVWEAMQPLEPTAKEN
ncbi:MAG: (Fe-S)-binding protein [Verrucomicrobia bacterium]|nr:(Fe-S)-binding protein [Verrucomicrobiota bacterium]